jgi:hypothetical protein
MNRLRTTSLAVTLVSLVPLLLVVASAQQQKIQPPRPGLGIEVATGGAQLFLPASAGGRVTVAHVLVPAAAGDPATKERVSAVRLMSQMDGGKVKVTVFALYGDAASAQSCADWKAPKASAAASYLAGDGETITINELRNLGVSFREGPITFRVVANPAAPAAAAVASSDCICALCNGMGCCPSEGECVRCNQCGPLCCFPAP